jgi:hypothetical protein
MKAYRDSRGKAPLILNVVTTWEWSAWHPGRSYTVPIAYDKSLDVSETRKFLMPLANQIPDFQPVAWSYLTELSRIPHYINYKELRLKPNPGAGKCTSEFLGRRRMSPLQLLSIFDFERNETQGKRILNFLYEFSHNFFLTLVSRIKILCDKLCCILTMK